MEQVKRKPGRPPKDFSQQVKDVGWTEGVALEAPTIDLSQVNAEKVIQNIPQVEEPVVPPENFTLSDQPQSISMQENPSLKSGNISEFLHASQIQNQEDIVSAPEEKVIPEGWYDISQASHNGIPIIVTDGQNKANVYWKKTRAFANATHKWEETGFWADEMSSQPITFKPLYWKYREIRR